MILGIDEVGRGPWAGPLVMGAVVLGGAEIEGLTDSKKLTKKSRERLYDEIYAKASGVGLGWVSAAEIDEIGLSEALRLATKRAVHEIKTPFHEIIIDGTVNFLVGTPLERHVTTMKKADLLVPSVSAASIVAKVARDRWMAEQDEAYPGYKFASHVGYGTAAHRAAIEKFGVTPLHRLSFAPLVKYKHSTHSQTHEHTASRHGFLSKISSYSAELGGHLKQSSNSEETSAKNTGLSRNVRSSVNVSTTREIGNTSETVAAEELVRRGHEIVDRNWKTKYCEIDIVSRKGGTIYFTEVKHRKNPKSGDGLAAITPKKLSQMTFAARLYAQNNRLVDMDLQLIAIATAGENPQVMSVVEIV